MKIINNDIKNKRFKSAYLLYGTEEFMKKSCRKRLVKAIAGEDTMNISFYEGQNIDVAKVIDMAETMPFLAEYRLIVMDDTGLFAKSADELAEYMENIPETTIFVFTESKVDKRSKLYKAVKSKGYVCEMNTQSEADLRAWIAGKLSTQGKKITVNDANHMLERVGTDMLTLSNELDKLIDYTYEKDVVTKEDIDAICTTQITVKVFDMIDAIVAKNQKKALESYYDLIANKEPPAGILFMITRQFNLMIQAKDLSSRGMNYQQMAETMGVQYFIAKNSAKQSENFSLKELKEGFADCIDIEKKFKSGQIDENIGVEMLLIKYSSKQSGIIMN